MSSPAVWVLGAVSWSGRRQLHRIEKDRITAAKATARLLGWCFLLPAQLSLLKQFALPKVGLLVVPPGLSLALSLGYLLGLNSPCLVLQSVAACSFLGR